MNSLDLNSYQLYLSLTKTKPFLKQTLNCQKIQQELLLSIINKNKKSLYGLDHSFHLISDIHTFQNKIPIQKYEDFEKYIEDAKNGIPNSIISEQIEYFAITSGTTSYPKFIPQTKNYFELRKKAWQIWVNNLYYKTPKAFSIFGSILTFTAKPFDDVTKGNTKYGSISGKIHDMQPLYIQFLYSPPKEIVEIEDFELKYYLIVLFALKKNISLIVTPNPSTLILFAKKIDKYYYNLIQDLQTNSIKILEENTQISEKNKNIILKQYENINQNLKLAYKLKKLKSLHKSIYPKHIFTNLCSIGCWKGGSVGIYIKDLYKYYGEDVAIRDIGYMASEGTFTIPIEDSDFGDGILNIEANFYEFIEISKYDRGIKKTLLAQEIEIGKKYYIIITNENGLYRYFMDDIVEVTKFIKTTPVIRFIQKGKYFSSITGEKISEWEIISAINEVYAKLKINFHTFFVTANTNKKIPYYVYYIEFEKKEMQKVMITEFEKKLDLKLMELNIEYKEKRNTERLGPVKIISLPQNTIHKLKLGFSQNKNDSQVKVPKLIVLEKDKEVLKKLKLI